MQYNELFDGRYQTVATQWLKIDCFVCAVYVLFVFIVSLA